ncbi:MAG TPA: phosphoribosylanthranilate isomerase [Gemmatales bacterium]|mgnify:CR=1 FL=1|nr:phosphoribosylanthranilate isomerase [Gemmatales bacterium]HMP15651.1 phosphoribosylanthranilate isomerase [Gemmatales bacterium]
MKPIIKICGITSDACVDTCVSLGIETIGLNFYPPSPRSVSLEQARYLRRRLPHTVHTVGVFVRPDVDFLSRAVQEVGLDAVQLHGTDPAYWVDFRPPPVPLWLAQGVHSREDIETAKLQFRLLRSMNVTATAILLDAKVSGAHGGTGKLAPWDIIAQTVMEVPILLAGGLNPDNVRDAVLEVKPAGVDVASGVESRPGLKDPLKVAEFQRHALVGWKRLQELQKSQYSQ